MQISGRDLRDLARAKNLLEHIRPAIEWGNRFGGALEKIGHILPEATQRKVLEATMAALEKSWEYSLKTLSDPSRPATSPNTHKTYATISGAVGGVGIITLFIELPITTIIMLRAIADIARSSGEDFRELETKIACLEVFAFGGQAFDKDSGDTGYYAIRASLRLPTQESSKQIAKKGAAGMGAPFLAQLLAKIAAHYQHLVAAVYAAKIVPIAGAVVGAAVNIVFIDHFQEKATGHFIVRRLERKYGYQPVKEVYQSLPLPPRS